MNVKGHKNWFKKHQEQLSWSNKLGLRITAFVGTMLCAGIFALIALVSLPATLKLHSVVADVAWLAQTFLQLVLLSIILVGQNQQSARDQIQAEHQYEHQEKELVLQTEILNSQNLELAEQTKILEEIRRKK